MNPKSRLENQKGPFVKVKGPFVNPKGLFVKVKGLFVKVKRVCQPAVRGGAHPATNVLFAAQPACSSRGPVPALHQRTAKGVAGDRVESPSGGT